MTEAASWDALGCFFLEKKDIRLALFPRMDGMAGGFEKKQRLHSFMVREDGVMGVSGKGEPAYGRKKG